MAGIHFIGPNTLSYNPVVAAPFVDPTSIEGLHVYFEPRGDSSYATGTSPRTLYNPDGDSTEYTDVAGYSGFNYNTDISMIDKGGSGTISNFHQDPGSTPETLYMWVYRTFNTLPSDMRANTPQAGHKYNASQQIGFTINNNTVQTYNVSSATFYSLAMYTKKIDATTTNWECWVNGTSIGSDTYSSTWTPSSTFSWTNYGYYGSMLLYRDHAATDTDVQNLHTWLKDTYYDELTAI